MTLPLFELGFAGTPLRQKLVAAVLDGRKTTTTGLLLDYEVTGDPLPDPGDRFAMPGPDGRIAAVIEMVETRVVPMGEVDMQHVIDEGEGDESVEQWRDGHTRFFESAEMREILGDPSFAVDDHTLLVLQRFRMVET